MDDVDGPVPEPVDDDDEEDNFETQLLQAMQVIVKAVSADVQVKAAATKAGRFVVKKGKHKDIKRVPNLYRILTRVLKKWRATGFGEKKLRDDSRDLKLMLTYHYRLALRCKEHACPHVQMLTDLLPLKRPLAQGELQDQRRTVWVTDLQAEAVEEF
ncbi:hypothetical protein AK812_SmicGene47268 [Symbiodinium microadriaticum]|uniref:Uncharacterized protein n=1 Tax=Symbiodinium microadriaticum TaxID=2951 RepID=A0A1Q9BS31_SYMMI|nr:hypothetical protein AK812_SmicGene47268 [Symbiodinium microadriaticum]CAE7345442.1 unnamed protein product [Symbiodinium microadriaticum]CAE7378169.1 unnamed protein product [Symbiodinium sp. KB8]